MSGLADVLLPG